MGNLGARPSFAFSSSKLEEETPSVPCDKFGLDSALRSDTAAPQPPNDTSPNKSPKIGHHSSRSRLLSTTPAFVEASSGQLGEAFTLLEKLRKHTKSSSHMSTTITRTEIKLLQTTLQRLCILQAGEQDVLEILRVSNPDAYDKIAHQWLAQEYTQQRRTTPPPNRSMLTRDQLLRYSSKQLDKHQSLKSAHIPENKIMEVAQLLETLDQWDFDVLQLLNKKVTAKPIVLIGTVVIQAQRLDSILDLDYQQLTNFFGDVDDSYYDNPYHNRWHAAEVAQGVHFFLIEVLKEIPLAHEYRFAAIVAASVHDMGHPGVNNAYLVNTGHRLALQYNDISPLENMHCSRAFQLMSREGRRILAPLDKLQQKTFRTAVVSMIMETDNARHVALLEKFSKLSMSGNFNATDVAHHVVLLELCLHAVDVSNCARPWSAYRRWTKRIIDEFYLQGDAERVSEIEVSSIMDRTKQIPLEKFQVGFMNAIVHPVYTTLQQLSILNLTVPFRQLDQNIESWQRVIRGECTVEDLDKEFNYQPETEYVQPEENSGIILALASESLDESFAESVDDGISLADTLDDDAASEHMSRVGSAGFSQRSFRTRGHNISASAGIEPRTLARARSPRFRHLVQQAGINQQVHGRRHSQPAFTNNSFRVELPRKSSDGPPATAVSDGTVSLEHAS